MGKQELLGFLTYEATVSRPSEEVCKKISSLVGLLDFNSISPSWRNTDIHAGRRLYKSESFQSLPGSPLASRRGPIPKVSSEGRSINKYVSKYKSSEKDIDDKILNTIILSKLNKFSHSTYDDIRSFLQQVLGSSDSVELTEQQNIEEFVKEFVKLVFTKAASEEIFCPLYAKLLGEISQQYPIVLAEMNKLHKNYLEIFEECDETATKDYDAFVVKNREKKYRQGYSQFLGELTSLKILSVDKLVVIFETIFNQILLQGLQENKIVLNEQYIDCVLRIAKVLQHKKDKFFIDIKTSLAMIVNTSMSKIEADKASYISLSPKSRFLLMDVQDYLKV
jgi:hypothetical protein